MLIISGTGELLNCPQCLMSWWRMCKKFMFAILTGIIIGPHLLSGYMQAWGYNSLTPADEIVFTRNRDWSFTRKMLLICTMNISSYRAGKDVNKKFRNLHKRINLFTKNIWMTLKFAVLYFGSQQPIFREKISFDLSWRECHERCCCVMRKYLLFNPCSWVTLNVAGYYLNSLPGLVPYHAVHTYCILQLRHTLIQAQDQTSNNN